MSMAIKRIRFRSLARLNLHDNMDREDRNLAQYQLLLLEMVRQLLIISATIEKVSSRWGLPVPVIRQKRHRRYRFRPWLGLTEREEEGQYARLMSRLQLDDPVAYLNFIWISPELFQELGGGARWCSG